MRLAPLVALLLLAAAPARQSLGQFGRWGAFREGSRCFAVSQPLGRPGGWLAINTGAGARVQLYARLASRGSVWLKIDGHSFTLAVRDKEAWAPDGRADLVILRALRHGHTAELISGARHSRYPLAGLPSAVDAALVACAALEKSGVSP
jgi:hypothetical protein